jgi:Cu(I)/Ag(I) efflux system membrane protein CusA/SilA
VRGLLDQLPGLNIRGVQDVINTAVDSINIIESAEGLERYPVNWRYLQAVRDLLDQLRTLSIVTPVGTIVPLSRLPI